MFGLVRCHSLTFRSDLLMDYAIIGWEVTDNKVSSKILTVKEEKL